MRRAAVALLLVATACGGGRAQRFNDLPAQAATAPATAPAAPERGSSDLRVTGAFTAAATRDLQCSYTRDDFFVRGDLGQFDGVPVYLSLNVEKYRGPGRYAGVTQVLLRRISDDSSVYASWYGGTATATVRPAGGGADVEVSVLAPEAGTQAAGEVTIAGHVGCLGKPTPGTG
ncbi:MAG TPA: hypothetical protein VFQ85_19060 [Mycobacteriales bacterium]|nr:hypothetical protein [Mycobacteriales bacterium]